MWGVDLEGPGGGHGGWRGRRGRADGCWFLASPRWRVFPWRKRFSTARRGCSTKARAAALAFSSAWKRFLFHPSGHRPDGTAFAGGLPVDPPFQGRDLPRASPRPCSRRRHAPPASLCPRGSSGRPRDVRHVRGDAGFHPLHACGELLAPGGLLPVGDLRPARSRAGGPWPRVRETTPRPAAPNRKTHRIKPAFPWRQPSAKSHPGPSGEASEAPSV